MCASALSFTSNSGERQINEFICTPLEEEITGYWKKLCKYRQPLLKSCGKRCQRNDWFDPTATLEREEAAVGDAAAWSLVRPKFLLLFCRTSIKFPFSPVASAAENNVVIKISTKCF